MPVLEPATNPSPATTSDEPNDEAHPEAKQEAAAPAESKPSERPSSADKAATASAEDANAPQPAAPLDSEDDQGSAAETPRKPLVPVLPVSIPKESLGGNGAKPGVVHLPAVEPQGQGTDRDDAQRLTSGTLPQYRATGTP
jgi:hypothetical protein